MPRKMPFKFQKNKNDPWGVKSHQKFYNSGVWRKLRAAFIQLNPICVQCEKNDLVVIADVVDGESKTLILILPITVELAAYTDAIP